MLELEDSRKAVETQKVSLVEEAAYRRNEKEETARLEEVAGLKREEALDRLTRLVEEQHQDTLISRVRKLEQEESEDIDRKAKTFWRSPSSVSRLRRS